MADENATVVLNEEQFKTILNDIVGFLKTFLAEIMAILKKFESKFGFEDAELPVIGE